MTPIQLRRVAEVYGSQQRLARDLGIDPRTMRRRIAGEWPIPIDMGEQIAALMDSRADKLRGTAAELRRSTM